ncbi:MAG: isochorismatase family protein [Candidatus Krumholzibacteriia bacterium]
MAVPQHDLQPGDAVLVLDTQVDFCPGGALPVAEGDQVVPVLNRWLAAARERGVPVYAARDWHPPQHQSFRERGGEWPPHCLQESPGAAYHPDLELPPDTVPVIKGVRLDQDQYSAFDQTGLGARLRQDGVRRLWVGGLTQDVCVRASVLDALRLGFTVMLLADATRPVDPENGRRAIEEMREAGAIVTQTESAASA